MSWSAGPAQDAEDAEVAVGIRPTAARGWRPLIAAGYTVYPVNPLQASRYREGMGCPAPRPTR